MQIRLLLIEDEAPIREMLRIALNRHGFQVDEAANAAAGMALINQNAPDLILLDWMLPDQNGIDVAKKLKSEYKTRDIPIIMVTAKGEEEDKIKGLETGADDYVTKPLSPRELVARIKTVLRRVAPTKSEKVLEAGKITLDPGSHRVTIENCEIALGPTEFKLLHYFISNQERVYNRSQLLNNVWGTHVFVEERTVDVHIRRLRKALTESGCDKYIETVRGTGYRFSVPQNV